VKASGDAALVKAVLDDYRTAPIDERLRGTLAFLERLILAPAEVAPADADRARASGANDRALEEAVYVAFAFGIIDRLADAFDFQPETGRALDRAASILLRVGYRAASVPG
jgi:alkylhydroperoxidase family enzyme